VGALALRCLRSGGGVEVACEADQVTPSYVNYVEVVGEEGNVFASILDGLATLRFLRGRGWEPPRRFGRVDLVRRELEHFVSCLASGCRPPLTDSDLRGHQRSPLRARALAALPRHGAEVGCGLRS